MVDSVCASSEVVVSEGKPGRLLRLKEVIGIPPLPIGLLLGISVSNGSSDLVDILAQDIGVT